MLFSNSWKGKYYYFCCDTVFKFINPFLQFSASCQDTLLRELRWLTSFNSSCYVILTYFFPCSVLGTHFPHSPPEEELSWSILASANASNATQNQFYILSKFALTYRRLNAGGALLPDLIEFYQWIHRELAYLVTKNYAQRHGLEEVITKTARKCEIDLFQLYERVKGVYLLITL